MHVGVGLHVADRPIPACLEGQEEEEGEGEEGGAQYQTELAVCDLFLIPLFFTPVCAVYHVTSATAISSDRQLPFSLHAGPLPALQSPVVIWSSPQHQKQDSL